MSFAWSPELATGNTAIDNQHKELFAAASALFSACQIGKERQEVERTMEFLVKYTLKHFAEEEALQQEHDYPHCLAHKQLHDEFKRTVQALALKMFQETLTDDFISEVYITIGEWLLNHIRGEDFRMVEYIQSKTQTI